MWEDQSPTQGEGPQHVMMWEGEGTRAGHVTQPSKLMLKFFFDNQNFGKKTLSANYFTPLTRDSAFFFDFSA